MASVRYIILSLIYIIDYYFIIYKKEEDSHAIYHNPIFVFFTSTFIFMFIVKYNENNIEFDLLVYDDKYRKVVLQNIYDINNLPLYMITILYILKILYLFQTYCMILTS